MKILTISNAFLPYAGAVTDQLKAAGIRCELDTRDEKLGYKIREAQLDKVPYMIVLGRNELENGMVSVRGRDEGDLGSMSPEDLIRRVQEEA